MASKQRISTPKTRVIVRKNNFDLIAGPEPWNLIVALNWWTEVDGGKPCLTPDCMSEVELNACINMIEDGLERIRAAGLRRFRYWNWKRTRAYMVRSIRTGRAKRLRCETGAPDR
jgi:hypothetical protein